MYGLRLSATQCPDGIEPFLRDSSMSAVESVYGRQWYRYRTARREPVKREFQKLDDPLVVRFVNANTEDKRVVFLGRFGLPFAPDGSEPRGHIIARQMSMRRLLAAAGRAD